MESFEKNVQSQGLTLKRLLEEGRAGNIEEL